LLLRLAPRVSAASQFLALNQRIEQLSQEVLRRRRAEESLPEQREGLQGTPSSIGDAGITTHARGQGRLKDPVAQAPPRGKGEEAAGRPLDEVFRILNGETRGPADNPVARVLRDGAVAGLANHTVLVTRDGTELPIDDCAAPILTDGRSVAGVVLVFHDVTE